MGEGGDTRPRRRPSARAWWPEPRQIDEGAPYPTPRAWEKGRGPRSWWKSGQRWRPRARAVAAVCSNRSVMRISTLAVAFLRPIWSMGPFDLPGGPNTNVSSPLANQVHSMTLCALQVVLHHSSPPWRSMIITSVLCGAPGDTALSDDLLFLQYA